MTDKFLGAARIFASHYQLVICEDPRYIVSDAENWSDDKIARGYAGASAFRMVRTEAHLNDHWVELVASNSPPDLEKWQRVTCVDFVTVSGNVHVMSVIDDEPSISATVEPGEYAVYFAAQNLGVDQLSLGELKDKGGDELTDEEFALRKDFEWYRLFIVRGRPTQCGRIVDRQSPGDIGTTGNG
ncbi:MAG: hypothetical protein KDA55_18725 [Planctomycetales bacterium]|nr:hypothetical protein [Planctomycetales bacterium]